MWMKSGSGLERKNDEIFSLNVLISDIDEKSINFNTTRLLL